ncbi:hypothetical protein DPMN_093108 [Dreissena polymorpha]|uniref:Uncharacterized protein n=1 Tax=Dreissena polymorpha TaxID=45954 RepID=A0A9D4L3H4_DREPO|nr:hypothetical protein DPMN_093108 [Dreissena polymorpha]
MHRDIQTSVNGGENQGISVSSKCTSLCGQDFRGRSCGKIVMVDVSFDGRSKKERTYAILDNQSNRPLISPELCEKLGVSGDIIEYTLAS